MKTILLALLALVPALFLNAQDGSAFKGSWLSQDNTQHLSLTSTSFELTVYATTARNVVSGGMKGTVTVIAGGKLAFVQAASYKNGAWVKDPNTRSQGPVSWRVSGDELVLASDGAAKGQQNVLYKVYTRETPAPSSAQPPAAGPAAPSGIAEDGNQKVANGDFSASFSHWIIDPRSAGRASFTIVAGAAAVVITNPGTIPGEISLNQEISLAKNVTYKVAFSAKADAPRTMGVGVTTGPTKPNTNYSPIRVFNLATSMTGYSFTFTMPVDDAQAWLRLAFGAGGTVTAYVDDVSVRKVTP
jgi:hypothetical protein